MSDQPHTRDEYIQARANAILAAYYQRYAGRWNGFEILEVESEFCFPLLNPETKARSRSFDEAGKIDVKARELSSGSIVVVEHKTTSDSIAPDSTFWDRLRMDTQCSRYWLASAQNGETVDRIIYDVMSKPMHRPSAIPLLDENGYKQVFDSYGKRVMTKDGKKPRETGDSKEGWIVKTRQETPQEFEARLLAVLIAEANDYFAQREVPRLDSDLIEYMEDTWAMTQQILYARNKNLWPRNPDACSQFGTCEFLDLCAGRASVDGVRFGKRSKIHSELNSVDEKSTWQLLTNSRAKALRKCARYHKLRYEDGIERISEDEHEALYLGTLVHEGLGKWFNDLKRLQTK